MKSNMLKGLDKQNIWALNFKYFLIHQFEHMFWVLEEPSQWDGSFEYPQHMFWLRNKKINFFVCSLNQRPGNNQETVL